MTDRIEKMLSIALQDANKALGEARRSVRVIEADANEIERLLSIHLQSKQAEAETTQAWDPALVAAANGSAPNRTVPDRSGEVFPPATPAQPSPPPASEPLPADQQLHESDPTRVNDVRDLQQGGAS